MKLLSILARVTAAASAAAVVAILSNQHADAAYSLATSAFLLLIAVRDYSPRRRWQPQPAPGKCTPRRPAQTFRLAA